MLKVLLAALVASIMALIVVGSAEARNPFLADEAPRKAHPLFEANPFKSFPECAANGVLAKIERQFRHAENRTWKRGFLISDIRGIRTLQAKESLRPELHSRRYCQATAHFSDGRNRKLHYLIEEGAGFVGIGYNVAYCINGLDPWRVSDGFCRTVRPF